jgi:hypothetical protein
MQRVLSQNNNWMIHEKVLYTRSGAFMFAVLAVLNRSTRAYVSLN